MKVLVDSSVWIDHLRRQEPELCRLLTSDAVVTHSGVIGELACGSIRRRDEFLAELVKLPRLQEATMNETLLLVKQQTLWGRGLGWIDAHLLAACLVERASLWTRDAALNKAAIELGIDGVSS